MGSVEEAPTLSDLLADASKLYADLWHEAGRLQGSYDEVNSRLDAERLAISDGDDEVEILEQVTTLLQGLEESWNKEFQKSVARVISRGLTLVFEQPMELKITPRVLRDVTVVEFTIVTGEGAGAIETPILGSKGGTVVALVNVLLRTLLIMSARPALRRILILDEPFGLADDKYIPAFGELLRELVDRLGFQIIIVSHEEALIDIADFAYEAVGSKKHGTSFKQVRSRNEVHA